MIESFEGTLGGGKTYSACERMLKYAGNGGIVRTNVALKLDGFRDLVRRRFGWELGEGQVMLLEGEQCSEFHKHVPEGTKESPTLVVIDEAHLWLDARKWSKRSDGVNEMMVFLTQSRKVGIDVIFISQSMDNVDAQVRRLIEYVWRFRDLRKWKLPIIRVKYPIKQLLQVQYDRDGRTELDRRYTLWDSEIFAVYDTTQLLRTFPVLERMTGEALGRSVRTVRRFWSYWLPFAAAAVAVWYYGQTLKVDMASGAVAAPGVSVRGSVTNAVSTSSTNGVVRKIVVLDENFLAWGGSPRRLITDKGEYVFGEICRLGRVVGLTSDKVSIETPAGQRIIILRQGWDSGIEQRIAMAEKLKPLQAGP